MHLPSAPVEGQSIPRPRKKRQVSFVDDGQGATAPGGKPRRGSAAKPDSGSRRKPFVHAPVKVDPEVMMTFAQLTRYADKRRDASARYAVMNVIFTMTEANDWPKERLWDSLGRINSALRGLKTVEGADARHMGWRAVQRMRIAVQRNHNDPLRQGQMNHPMRQFIREALLAMDTAMAAILKNNPELEMNGEELAGMAPPLPEEHYKHPLFKKPPSLKGQPNSDAEPNVNPDQLELDLEGAESATSKPGGVLENSMPDASDSLPSDDQGVQPNEQRTTLSLASRFAGKLRTLVGL